MSAKPVSPGPRYPALLDLLRTADTVWNASRNFFGQWDLSPSQFNILNLLVDAPGGRTQVNLSRELLMHRSNVTGLVDRLERRGLVQRREQPDDRRTYRIVLTPTARQLLETILPRFYVATEEVWDRLPAQEVRRFVQALARIRTNAKRMADALDEPGDDSSKPRGKRSAAGVRRANH